MDDNTLATTSGSGELTPDDHALAFIEWLKTHPRPYKELMSFYTCAMMQIETKFRILSEDLSLQYNRNPIESIQTRLKTPESIMRKILQKRVPISLEAIEENICDIAGVRVICSFCSDVYMLAKALLIQDDITQIQIKDYIQSPKPNGYRSLHLIVSVPIYLHSEKRVMRVEVQLRTLAMNLWATTEHKIRYKKDYILTPEADRVLLECAEECASIDQKMESLYQNILYSKL